MKQILLVAILVAFSLPIFGQTGFYKDGDIHEVKITFTQTNWDYLLDSFYVDGDEERLLASIEINGETFDSVGIRYKGFSSVSVDRKKNPFNIKLDYVKEQDYNGVDKLKLGNVIQDPSFIREALSYEIARKYMPASGSNYVTLYINNVYWGVYSNVQDVDKGFLRASFGSGENTFVKANPESLDLNGENCNLSNSPGTDSMDYTSLYEMKSDYGYSDLYELIDVLNNTPSNIEDVLNVDRTLWMHALNYVLVNFDGYIGYAQNYYLYKDGNGQFNPILWDLNQSFGSFRLTDASDYFQGFSVQQAQQIDPLSHYNSTSVYARPLMRNLFNNDRYRKMYLAHIKTITEENFANGAYKIRASALQTAIDSDVMSDPNKFYSNSDFMDNLTKTVSDLVDYPGISDLMDNRSTYLENYTGYSGGPEITIPNHLLSGNNISISTTISNATEVILAYRDNNSSLFIKTPMLDDGMHNDGASGDGVYGAIINNKEALQYYVYAENSVAGSFSPSRAAYEFYSLKKTPKLVINEICASNDNIIMDPQGDYEDWIELYNNTNEEISLKGYSLSDDNSDLQQWMFPDTVIEANGYLLIWADKDDGDSGLHAEFKLSASGESVFLSNDSNQLIDEVTFGAIPTDTTYGRSLNGVGDFYIMGPTPSAENQNVIVSIKNDILTENKVLIYPNPVNDLLHVELSKEDKFSLTILNASGCIVHKEDNPNSKSQIDVSTYPAGLYLIQITNSKSNFYSKIIIK